MNYLGLDYHKKYSFATIITEDGEIKEKERLLNRKESFEEYLHKYEEVVAVVEACWSWPVAVELLEGLVDEVKLEHPLKVKAIAEARIKTDSIDSETLAYLLRADLIPEAYLRDKSNLQRQKILRITQKIAFLRDSLKKLEKEEADIKEQIDARIQELTKAKSEVVRDSIEKSIIELEQGRKENDEKRLSVHHTILELENLISKNESLFGDYSGWIHGVMKKPANSQKKG